jgi:hypothetical protein
MWVQLPLHVSRFQPSRAGGRPLVVDPIWAHRTLSLFPAVLLFFPFCLSSLLVALHLRMSFFSLFSWKIFSSMVTAVLWLRAWQMSPLLMDLCPFDLFLIQIRSHSLLILSFLRTVFKVPMFGHSGSWTGCWKREPFCLEFAHLLNL